MDVADRIKDTEEWTPLVDPNTKEAQIGRWAAGVDPRDSPDPVYQEVGRVWPGSSPQQSALEHTPRSRAPADLLSASGNSPISSISFPSRRKQLFAERTSNSNLYRNDSRHTSMPLIDLSEDQSQTLYEGSWHAPADMQRQDSHQVRKKDTLDVESAIQRAPSPLSQSDYQQSPTAADGSAGLLSTRTKAAKQTSPSHIHRLTEPVSTRKRSKKEDIILLKASVVNGFKCPPWDKSPSPTDFLPQNGQGLFQYVGSYYISI